TTLHREGEGLVAYTTGAPERLLPRCRTVWRIQGPVPIQSDELHESAERMAAEGLRVMALAFREWPELPAEPSPETVETGLCFLGF
ncbi:hypothetical protein ACSHWI_15970, partial [Methylococcus sp. S2T]|uniref:hypothetical protein n=1 Tax=Methylococcus sp. S2T TaxID=3438967 RepID=UPI003ED8E705